MEDSLSQLLVERLIEIAAFRVQKFSTGKVTRPTALLHLTGSQRPVPRKESAKTRDRRSAISARESRFLLLRP